jgi:hypothetical protein
LRLMGRSRLRAQQKIAVSCGEKPENVGNHSGRRCRPPNSTAGVF